ncbi:hypothetical protein N7489_003923 [Penicillium chrysogenum]|uniref:uncharacterized protein n=1 Tax=Penicillium chrysogenum TaxID=5076 RepID=UPI0024DF25D1|nr:uncharacterized protein N7489_003923 [Penicillium chrysogenum]KAJ5243827.1 hypothetical protein N7489_003923 [Penicillium chrysogenum]
MIPTNRLVGIREPETGSTNWEGRYCAFTTDLIVANGEEYTFYHLSRDGLWSKEGIVVLTRSHIRSLAKESNNYRSSLNKTAAIDPKSGKSSLRCVNATQSQQNLEDVVKAASMSMVSLLLKELTQGSARAAPIEEGGSTLSATRLY